MLFNKTLLSSTILITSLLSVGCYNPDGDKIQSTGLGISVNRNVTYQNKPLVKAFFDLKDQMKLPVEDFYKKIRSFDKSNTFIERSSTPQEELVTDIGVQRFKVFSDGEPIELIVSTLSDSPFDEDKGPKISSIELILKEENISFKFINYAEQVSYMVEKYDNNTSSQELACKNMFSEEIQGVKYFDIVKELNNDINISIDELANKTNIEFVKMYDSGEDAVYSYMDEKSSTVIEIMDGKIENINCSIEGEFLGPTYGEVNLIFDSLSLDKKKVSTTLTVYSLEDMINTSKELN